MVYIQISLYIYIYIHTMKIKISSIAKWFLEKTSLETSEAPPADLIECSSTQHRHGNSNKLTNRTTIILKHVSKTRLKTLENNPGWKVTSTSIWLVMMPFLFVKLELNIYTKHRNLKKYEKVTEKNSRIRLVTRSIVQGRNVRLFWGLCGR